MSISAISIGQTIAVSIAPNPRPTSQSEPENPPPWVENVTVAIAPIVNKLIASRAIKVIRAGLKNFIPVCSFTGYFLDRLQRSNGFAICCHFLVGCQDSILYTPVGNQAPTTWQRNCCSIL